MSEKSPVKQLNAEVARKIAAGEVIDRPNSIVRELMDNAIDSGANKITVEISGGGIDKIRVIDNGSGMTKEDLKACAREHATSKISTDSDLLNLSTLGFRGEALASMAAVSRLSIHSSSYKMFASITEDHIIQDAQQIEGTIVQTEGLFENIPARRSFLKRPSSEGTLCKTIFIEKTLSCPEKAFRFISDGQVKLNLPSNQTLKQRFVSALELKEDLNLFNEFNDDSKNKDFSFTVVIGEPGVYRNTKKDIYIFVNGRRINEYSLVQAIEYGSQGFFPNGTFPIAALYVNINPSLVDFNIHPAKKEVRFRDISELHHAVSSRVREFFKEYTKTKISNKNTNESDSQKLFDLDTTSLSGYEKFAKNFNSRLVSTVETQKSDDIKTLQTKKTDSSNNTLSNNTFSDKKLSENILSNVRQKFFTDYPNYETKTDYTYKEKEVSYTASKNLINTDKKQKTERVIQFLDKAINAYNGLQTITLEESAHDELSSSASIAKKITLPESITKEVSSNEKVSHTQTQDDDTFNFIGSALGTFIIAEKNNTLYIIDKHAAHERILYNKIINNKGQKQNLIIPYIIQTQNKEEDEYLESIKETLNQNGFTCSSIGNGQWEFISLHERWNGTQEDLQKELLENKVNPEELIYKIAASAACKAAVKDGYILDDKTASDIAKEALQLEDPHCPHGRPIYTSITRERLFELVRRT